MGYTLTIGDLKPEIDYEERSVVPGVEKHSSEDAPLSSSFDYSNTISPSYTTWSSFARETGLIAVFYYAEGEKTAPEDVLKPLTDEDGLPVYGLLRNSPGVVPLNETIYRAFKEARDKWVSTYPPIPVLVVAKDFEGIRDRYPELSGEDVERELNRRRLEWLVYWTRWALDNTKYPSFGNG
jgi:hypothetical protein